MKAGFDLENLGVDVSEFFEIPETATIADIKIFIEMLNEAADKAYADCFKDSVQTDGA